MNKPLNRRKFLGTTVAGAVTFPAVVGGLTAASNQDPIKIGLIGCGGYGMADVRAAFKVGGVEIVALCDADSQHLNESADKVEAEQGKRPQLFKHYQDLLDVPGLQAVIIATPPQWHALQFIDSLEHGLDVYCEKPLAYDVREGRAMVDASAKSGQVVQIGFQRRQSPAFQQVREYLKAGKAGEIVQVEAQIHYTAGLKDSTPQDPPASLDWDLWCGPAPKLPYSPQIGHVNWRLEKEYGHGHLVDWGIHLIDATRVILDEGSPRTVQASGGLYRYRDRITTPDILTVHYEFDTCPVTWRHHIWGATEYSPEVKNGIFIYGDKATVFVTDQWWEVVPRGNKEERVKHQAGADMGRLQMEEFLTGVRTRNQPGCSTADAHRSTTAVKLAMISYDLGRKITWNDAEEIVIDDAVATQRLKRDYRRPWVHPSTVV